MTKFSQPIERTEKIFVLGKSFPSPSKKFGEADCIGGVILGAEKLEWVRLYPVIRRRLKESGYNKIPSFSIIECKITKYLDDIDKRKESYKIWEPSVKILKQKTSMEERAEIFYKILSPHYRHLETQKKKDKYSLSLGMIEIEVLDFKFRKLSQTMTEDEVDSIQEKLFESETNEFEKPGHNLTIKFRCKNNPDCSTHGFVYKAEEYETAYNKYKQKYPEDYIERLDSEFRKRYMNPDNITYAIMGTMITKYFRWLLGGLTHLRRDVVERYLKRKEDSEMLELPLEFFSQ